MTVQVKINGSWHTAPNGGLFIKSGGAWRVANNCYIKINGGWHDSGYRGLPAVPGTPAVYAWDYNNIGIYWGGGAGGAPVTNYIVQRLDYWGNVTDQWDVGSATSFMVGIHTLMYYQFRIYARTAAGLQAGPGGLLRVHIGLPRQEQWGNATHTRGWESHTSGQFNEGNWIAVTIPSSVTINAVHWRNMRTPQSGVLIYDNRDIDWILNSGEPASIQNYVGTNPTNCDYAGGDIGINGNNGYGNAWGVVPRGSGWSTTGNTTYMLWVDDFWFDGTETYVTWDLLWATDAVGNTYW